MKIRKKPAPHHQEHAPDKLIRLDKFHLFWIIAALLAIMLTAIMAHDITKPFIELHSWGRAHDAWVARSHVVYGLGYTKGFDTFAVGNPPPKKPTRYLDHPVLFTLLDSAAMRVFGINEWSLRVMNIICTIISLFLFLKILRHLFDDVTALLAGLFFCLFPLIAFFGVNMWLYPLVLLAFWCYLAIIGALRDVTAKKWHKYILAVAIFLAIQMTWEGFFFAMVLGIHYVFHCLKRRKKPDWKLFSILAIVPFASLALDFTILAAGHDWDFKRLFELARIRSTSGELASLSWSVWFERFLHHALTNFSLPIIVAVLFSITVGQIYAAIKRSTPSKHDRSSRASQGKLASPVYSLRFNQFWLFVMPAFFQLVLMKGTLYPHQYWERPMVLGMAIGTALAIMIIFDILKKHNRIAAMIISASITILLCASCIYGITYYYGIRWQNPKDIELYKYLKSIIPQDKKLLSFDPHIIDQFPGIKAASYRPEVAWYLDREIVTAQTLPEIIKYADTGQFPYYLSLMPCERFNTQLNTYLAQLNAELAKRYKIVKQYPYIPWIAKKPPWIDKEEFFIRGMLPQTIYDLSQKPSQ